MITIVDYGVGNLLSIKNLLKKIGVRSIITSDIDEIASAEKLIIPGVGSFDYGISSLRDKGFENILNKKAFEEKIPTLGICLGMQLMTKRSEEGTLPGLGWFDADTIKFNTDPKFKIPHMGWSEIVKKKDSKLFHDMDEETRFYFVHSFHVRAFQEADVAATCKYDYDFCCAIEKENIAGVQFHPEKSHKYGMKLLSNFNSNY